VVAEVARQHDLAPQQLSNWIKAAKEGRIVLPAPEPDGEFGEVTDAAFVPVVAVQAYWTVQPMAGWLPSANLSEPEVVDNSTILFNFSDENSTNWPSMQPRSLIARRKQRLPLNGGFAYWFSLLSRVLGQHTLLYVEREFEFNLAEYRVLTVLEDRD
jgi:transposase-like protein